MRRPLFVARQARHPSGVLGKMVASIMLKETGGANERAVRALNVQRGDHVLDIGCGSGLSLSLLAGLAPNGHSSGVDPSELMVERAVNLNKSAVKAHLVDVKVAAMEQLPYPNEQFDKIMSVHTVYFVEELDMAFAEIARVAKPGARLVLILRALGNKSAVNDFPSEVYTFRPMSEIVESLERAGFAVDEIEEENNLRDPALVKARRIVL